MSLTFDEYECAEDVILEPAMLVSPIADFPTYGVSCFSKKLHDAILTKYGGELIQNFFTEDGGVPIYKVNYRDENVALYMSKVGAPAVAMQMEEAYVMGLRKLVVMGSCGTLDSSIEFGDLIIPTSGIRDEGTSYHYFPAWQEIETCPLVIDVIRGELEKRNCSYVCGKTWTTDGLYRETVQKTQLRKKQGCIVVEMEYTAMQAVANYRGMKFGQILYSEDNLDAPVWEDRGYLPKNHEKSNLLLGLAFDCVLKL
jgi:uridine phosphorylase